MPCASQPRHRRPSWRQSRISHRTYLETDFHRKQKPDLPADADTFYYNPAFLAEWSMPVDLWVRLPMSLTTELKSWQATGAAVCTALARIDKLDAESVHRGWPTKNNAHLSRSTSDSSAIASPRSPVVGSPTSTLLSASTLASSRRGRTGIRTQDVTNTPPLAPQNSTMDDDLNAKDHLCHDKISLEYVNNLLANEVRRASETRSSIDVPSPLAMPTSRRDSANDTVLEHSMFDESAWDVFIRSYEAELEHLRTETLVRFRHMGRSVDRLWLDLEKDSTRPILDDFTAEFVTWWQKMGEKAQDYEKEIQMLEPPQVDMVRVRRSSQGLPI